MANNPAEVEQQINDITKAWTELAPTATFGGMTLTQYTAAVKPSLDARGSLASLDEQKAQLIVNRDNADLKTEPINATIVKGVVGDVAYGDDSALYEKMGYVRSSQRKTGLTRKSKNSGANPPAK